MKSDTTPPPALDAAASTRHEARPIAVFVTDDRLAAFVSIEPGSPEGEAELRRALEVANVRAGIDDAKLDALGAALADPTFEIAGELVARGSPAEPGEAARFESPYLAGLQPGHLREDGTLDFHDRELLKPVHPGDWVGQLHAARRPRAGQCVDGTLLSPPPLRETRLNVGPGARLDEHGVVRAARAGAVLCKTPDSVDVVDQFVHEGAVNLQSGHLHMLGSLAVKGDVESSFCVYASGDVDIRGGIDNGSVHAGGNLHVQRGVRGAAGTTVSAEGGLSAHHAEYATLYAGGLLAIGDAVHSSLSAERIEVSGKLRGGVARAERSVVVREAGTPQGTHTEIAAAEPVELPVAAAQRALERAKAVRGVRAGEGPGRAALTDRSKGNKAGRVQAELQAAETRRLKELAARRRELSRVATIRVAFAHPGVTLKLGEQKLLLEHPARDLRIAQDPVTGELRTGK